MTSLQPPRVTMPGRARQSAIATIGWTQLPGGAIFVAAAPDGSLWALSNAGPGPDRAIWHYTNSTWTNVPGAATRLGIGPDGTAWAVNAAGGIYRLDGANWTTIAGGASDISVGSDGAPYAISNQPGVSTGRGIWHYVGGTWTQLPGAAVHVAASWDAASYPGNIASGGVWVAQTSGAIYHYDPGSGWVPFPGGAVELAATKNGGLFALGNSAFSDGNYPIYYNDLSAGSWTLQSGAAVSISTNTSNVYAAVVGGGIFTAPVGIAQSPSPTSTPTATSSPVPIPTPTPTPTPTPNPTATPNLSAATTSRYMATTNVNTLYNKGCSMGSAGLSGAVVLDFGQPWTQNGTQGSIIFAPSLPFKSIADITAAAEAYLDGFYNCSPRNSTLRLAVGTSNYHYPSGFVPADHGAAWGNMVNALSAYISNKGYGAQEFARGANDMEPSWESVSHTRAWVDGYNSATALPLYNYGSADGCPPYGSCNNGWTQNDLWYVSYGSAASYPLPEIYYQSQVSEWYQESLYSALNKGAKMSFLGTMTEYSSDSSTFTPSQGFQALQNALNADSRTAYPLTYSTDITHAN